MTFPSLAALLAACAALAALPVSAQDQIIPKPVEIAVAAEGGPVLLDASTRLAFDPALLASGDKDDKAAARYVVRYLRAGTGLPLNAAPAQPGALSGGAIVFRHDLPWPITGPEAYALKAGAAHDGKASRIDVRAASPKALYPAVHSLAQMMPPAFFDPRADKSKTIWKLADRPFSILDYPRFGWRSLMIDEARYFFGMENDQGRSRPDGLVENERPALAPDRRRWLAHRDQKIPQAHKNRREKARYRG